MLGLLKFIVFNITSALVYVMMFGVGIGAIFSPGLAVLAGLAILVGYYYVLRWVVPIQLWWKPEEEYFNYEVDQDQ
tara:strand:+ start:223 stop:450 length:228 start_codon:yes stop_codon:yes gene_type:complete